MANDKDKQKKVKDRQKELRDEVGTQDAMAYVVRLVTQAMLGPRLRAWP